MQNKFFSFSHFGTHKRKYKFFAQGIIKLAVIQQSAGNRPAWFKKGTVKFMDN